MISATDKLPSVMSAAGRGSEASLKQFRDWFGLGAGPLTRAKLSLTYLPQPIPLQAETTTLVRALLEIDGLHFAEGFTGDLEVLRCMYPEKHGTRWWPFLTCEGGSFKPRGWRADGHMLRPPCPLWR